MSARFLSRLAPLMACVGIPAAFCAGVAVVWFGPVTTRDEVLSQWQADIMRTAAYEGVAPSEAPRFALIELSDGVGSAIIAREKASECIYYGTVKPDSNTPPVNALAVFTREVCPGVGVGDSTREIIYMAALGTISEPAKIGSEISIVRTMSVPGLGRIAPDLMKEQANTLMKELAKTALLPD